MTDVNLGFNGEIISCTTLKSTYLEQINNMNKGFKDKNIDGLILAIDDYINYYNYDGIKAKLKGLSL